MQEIDRGQRGQLGIELLKTLYSYRDDTNTLETDYMLDGLLHCSTCTQPKERVDTIEMLDAVEALKVLTLCECEQAERELLEQERKDAEHRDMIERLRKRGLRSVEDIELNFDNDDSPDSTASIMSRNYVDNFSQMQADNIGLYFYGNVGTGKTYYAVAIANALIEQGYTVLVTTLTEQVDMQSGFDKEGKALALDRVKRVDLLILDDVGAERDSDYVNEQVYQIVNTRYTVQKPLLVASNLSPHDLREQAGANSQRVADRLTEMANVPVRLTGASRRERKSQDKVLRAYDLLMGGQDGK